MSWRFFFVCVFILVVGAACLSQSPPDKPDPKPTVEEAWKRELRHAFMNCQTAQLRSLHPNRRPGESDPSYFGHAELGSAEISGAVAGRLARSLQDAVDANEDKAAAFCFLPRHGLALDNYDLVICFQCSSINVYQDGNMLGHLYTTALAEPDFRRAVKEQGLAWPGWDIQDEPLTLSHASGLWFTENKDHPVQITRDPVDDWLYFESPLEIPEDFLASEPGGGRAAKRSFQFEFLQAEKFAAQLTRIYRSGYGVDPNTNVFTIDLTGSQYEKMRELVSVLDRPEHSVVSVKILPLRDKSEATELFRRLPKDFELSELEFEEVSPPDLPIAVDKAMRAEGKVTGVQSEVVLGLARIHENTVFFQATVPVAAERWEFVRQQLSSLKTFSGPLSGSSISQTAALNSTWIPNPTKQHRSGTPTPSAKSSAKKRK